MAYVLTVMCVLVLVWCVSFEVRLRKHQVILDPVEAIIKFVLYYFRS